MLIRRIEYRSVKRWRRIIQKNDSEENDKEREYDREEVVIRN